MKTLALILALLSSLPLRATIISSFQRLDPTTEPTTLTHNFSGGGPVWANYTFLFAGIQDYLVGGDLLRTSYYDGSDPDFQLRVTLDVPATVFLIIDNHVPDVATTMPWVAALGFHDTGNDVLITTLPTTASIYSGSFPAGDLVLLQQNDLPAGHSGMYIVGAIPEPASLSLLLFGAPFCLRRRSPRNSNSEETANHGAAENRSARHGRRYQL